MAKPIARTPVLTGADAVAVLNEIKNGTPTTPERRRTLDAGRKVYARHRKGLLSAS